HSSPATRDIQWLAAWVLTGDAVFADSDPRISADLQHLISLYLRLIKSGLEGALVRLGDVRLRSRRQDQHAAVRIELRNRSRILLFVAFSIGGNHLVKVLLEVSCSRRQ